MRVGRLTEARLLRAAHYGHAAARCATGTDDGDPAWHGRGAASRASRLELLNWVGPPWSAHYSLLRVRPHPNLADNVRLMLNLAGSAFGMKLTPSQRGSGPSRAGNASWSTALLVLSEALVPWLLGRSSSNSPP